MPTDPRPTEAPEAPIFKLEKILVPLDFSEGSRKALAYAIAFARQFGGELMLFHVMEPYYPGPEVYGQDVEFLQRRVRDAAQRDLQAVQRTIAADVLSRSLVRRGKPYLQIIAAATDLRADLIIISTQGHAGLAHTFLGSTAERVLRQAPCPVLVVREKEHEFIRGELNTEPRSL